MGAAGGSLQGGSGQAIRHGANMALFERNAPRTQGHYNPVADRAGTGVSIADLAAAWVLSRPAVGAAIIGARGQGKVDATRRIAGLRIPLALLDECTAAAEACLQPVPGEVYALEREREGKHGAIMRYNLQAMGGVCSARSMRLQMSAIIRKSNLHNNASCPLLERQCPRGVPV